MSIPRSTSRKGRVGLGLVLAGALAVCLSTAAPAFAADQPSPDPRDISGVWWTKTYTPRLVPIAGGDPPLTAKGRQLYAENQKAFKNRTFEDEFRADGLVNYEEFIGHIRKGSVLHLNLHGRHRVHDRHTAAYKVYAALHACLPPGVPRIMAAPYPFRIVQTRGVVTFLFEMSNVYRLVRMDANHVNTDYWDPTYSGESVGRWEGDTLVIDTKNFNDLTFLDRAGLPHSDKLHVVEKLRKISGGQQLEAIITIEDPEMYTAPWDARLVYEWRPDISPRSDQLCSEPHRDLSGLEGIENSNLDQKQKGPKK